MQIPINILVQNPQTQNNSFIDKSQNSCFSVNNERQIRLQFIATLLKKNIHSNLLSAFQELKQFNKNYKKQVFKERLVSLVGLILKNKVNQQLTTSFKAIEERA